MDTLQYHLLKIAVVIFAHNESLLIHKTTQSIVKALGKPDSLFVVADNCRDDTAKLACQAGAKVFVRSVENPQGKGAAMKWFIQNYSTLVLDFDYLVILDADSLIQIDFIDKIKLVLNDEVEAGQCVLIPVEYEDEPLSRLVALSEFIEHTVFESIRAKLGFSVRLRGTGMVLRPSLLLGVSDQIDTEVEDIVLSLLLAEKKIKVISINSVIVYDPKPKEMEAASKQRARWFRGQWVAFWKYRSIIIKLVSYGLNGWAVIGSLFMKPRWLKLSIMIALCLLLVHIPVLAACIFALVLFELSLFVFGVFRLPDKWKFVQALLYLPGFILMWIRGIVLSTRRNTWLRSRETGENEELVERGTKSLCNEHK